MLRPIIFILLFCALNYTSSAQAQSPTCPSAKSIPAKYAVEVIRNINYTGALILDIYKPKSKNTFPGIVFLHGGGWVAGSKDGFDGPARYVAERGLVVAAINYRLVRKNTDGSIDNRYPAALDDVKSAVVWLKKNAQAHSINPKYIGIFGESAGAHLALMAGLTAHDSPQQAWARVNCYGPSDINRLYFERSDLQKEVLTDVFSTQASRDDFINASPLTFLRKDSPPTLSIDCGAGRGDYFQLTPECR
jgi:acetyl esterase/lipase